MRMKKLSKMASYAIAAALMLSNVGGLDVQAATTTKAEVIEITADNVPVAMGKNVTLKAEVLPKKASKSIVWQSENPKYVTVSKNGTITGKAAGLGKFVKIYAKSADGSNLVTYTTVYVTKPTTALKTSKTSLTVNEGKKATIKTTVAPTKGSSKKLSFVSSNTKVATVNQKGQVTGKKAGTSYITVKTIDGTKLSKKVKVTVKKNVEVNKTITSNDIKDGSYTLDGGTYDNITIDKNVGTANITLNDVKVKNTLNLTKGSGYSVTALDSTIAKLKTVESKSTAALSESTNPSFTAGKGSTVSEMTVTVDMKIVEEDGAIKTIIVSPTPSAKLNVDLENCKGKLKVNKGTSAEVIINAKSCHITQASLAGKVSIKDTSAAGAAKSTIKTVNVTEEATQLDIGSGITVDKVDISGAKSTLKGSGTVKEATVSGNDVSVDTNGTKVTATQGTTGVTAGGNKVEPGKPVETPSGGGGGGGGGGGSITPTPEFVKVNPVYSENNTKATYTVNDDIKEISVAFKYSDSDTIIKEISVADLLKEFDGKYPENLKETVGERWNKLFKGAKTELLGYTLECTDVTDATADGTVVKEFTVRSSNGSAQDKVTGTYSVSKAKDVDTYEVTSIDGANVEFDVTLRETGFDVVGGRTTGEDYTIKFDKKDKKYELVVESKLAARLTIMVK